MDISDLTDDLDSGDDPFGGDEGGLDIPPPPPPPSGEDNEMPSMDDDSQGDDGMGGDEGSMLGGQDTTDMGDDAGGSDAPKNYDKLSPQQKDAADKYIDSMVNDDDDQEQDQQSQQMSMESRFNFKRLIDEAFMDIANGDKPTAFTSMTRPEKRAVKEADTLIDPFSPR